MRKSFLTALIVCSFYFAFADTHPAKIFSDSMVLQRGIKIPVWGWADKGEKISVQFNKQNKTVTTGTDGKWRVDLDAEREGGPYQMTIKGNNTISINDILVGDVWLCSGQSNMEFAVRSGNNSTEEIASANFTMIRHTKIPLVVADKPRADLGTSNGWHTAVPANVGSFTAVGYFFARKLYGELHVPIGLINSTWGGTDSETWTSREALENSDEFKELMAGFPTLNLDSVAAIRQRETMAKIINIQGSLPTPAAINSWKESSFNDNGWPHMQLPALWEQTALPNFDGVVWFRRTINLSAADAGKGADLLLGTIDDNDEVWVNGVKVGSTKGYNVKRIYLISPGIFHEGKNSIAIRVEDTGGGGGVYGDAAELKLDINGSTRSLAGDWSFQVESSIKVDGVGPNSYPTLLFNAMINPLVPYGIKGVIWYQGESNAGRAYQYRKAFPLMITDWRNQWKQGNFPFYFVQLASYNAGNGNSEKGSTWAELREAQTMTLSLPHTGMAVTTDIGEAKDIHPKNKQDVGKRLAAVALHDAYGRSNEYSGPSYRSMKVDGNKVTVMFDHKSSGLITTDPQGQVKGFEIAGADQKFQPAIAIIEGDHLIVSAANVSAPVAVRYAWSDEAGNANLYNLEKFPAVPFRTDTWKGITEATKYKIAGR
ncbi:MAG: sialate O-acetylesterase [Bacteroidota bacterium]